MISFHIGNEIVHPDEFLGKPVAMKFFFFQPSAISRKLEAAGFSIAEVVEREPILPMWSTRAGGHTFLLARLKLGAQRSRDVPKSASDSHFQYVCDSGVFDYKYCLIIDTILLARLLQILIGT